MKTLKINVKLSIGYANASRKDVLEVEVEDDATQEDIEKAKDDATSEWAHNYVDFGWSDEEDD